MSSSLKWIPVVERAGKFLSDDLKLKLAGRYLLSEQAVLSAKEIPYLEGLRDCGIPDADKLAKAIEKYGTVKIYLEY